jgi:hypothetical protein
MDPMPDKDEIYLLLPRPSCQPLSLASFHTVPSLIIKGEHMEEPVLLLIY